MKNKRIILFIIILLSFSTLKANTQYRTNEEGKLTDICCAFGVELGKKLNPELGKKLSSELVLYNKYLENIRANSAKKAAESGDVLKPISTHSDYFTPENPYEGFDTYIAYLIDEDSLVYSIYASGEFENCREEQSILSDIIMQKYDLIKSDILGSRDATNPILKEIPLIGEITFFNKRRTKSIRLSCSKKHYSTQKTTTLRIYYEDFELEALKDKIYKEKLMSQRNSSAI